jgi:hypothetical protein
VPTFSKYLFVQNSLGNLLKCNIAGCILIFLLLQLWRPYYFLTDDNLSGDYPVLIEMGRHLQHGEAPFISDYLFGGHYDWTRDPGCLVWHPFYLLPAMLADTWAKFWVMDLIAFLFLLSTTIGFTLLAHQLRNEFQPALHDAWLMFYTMSFVFSMYILTIGPSWICFLGSQSALPWLTLGILDRNMIRGTFIVGFAALSQFVGSYAGMIVSTSLLLTLFALGIAACRWSPRPFFIWCSGNMFALLIIAPFLLHVLDGLGHTVRLRGLNSVASSEFNVPGTDVLFSFFLGTWTEPLALLQGEADYQVSLTIPFVTSFFACAAAWCLLPALFVSRQWRPLEILCLGMSAFIILLVIRPTGLAEMFQYLPFIKSLRWPFREILQFLFFIHIFIILRPQVRSNYLRWGIPLFSLGAFLLPLFCIWAPTLNSLDPDRKALLSGKAELFWTRVKPLLQPSDQIATVIDWQTFRANRFDVPYSYLGTASFPSLYKIHCISGYSPTSPLDQLPLKTIPTFWFGAFDPTQVDSILRESPDLKLIVLEHMHPMKIVLRSKGRPDVDLTPYLPL